MKKLPIGIQSIEKILGRGEYVYVDKTAFALQLIQGGAPHYFYSRPRRFGKSLFLDTLAEIFKGNKDLFKGCAIAASDYDWQPYPVLYLNFAKIANDTRAILSQGIQEALENTAEVHQVTVHGSSLQSKLDRLVTALAKQSPIVVLIDEYDKPIIDQLHRPTLADENRTLLQGFFGVLKNLDKYVRFTFITGISKFSKVSLFSEANHLKDISMMPQYATMLGYTEEELRQNFEEHIQAITQERNRQGLATTDAQVLAEIKQWYNGYRFTKGDAYVYNPFSTLNFLDEKEAQSYWYNSGTPSFLIEQVRKHPETVVALSGSRAEESALVSMSSVAEIDLKALMFQAGYLTIQDYHPGDEDTEGSYTLDFPNREVRRAFFASLLKEFARIEPLAVGHAAKQVREDLAAYQLEAFFRTVNVHFAKIPYYVSRDAKEGFYQAVFFTLLALSGVRVQAEVPTNMGRTDLVAQLPGTTLLFELKRDQSGALALDQARRKEYAVQHRLAGKELLVLGVNFSSKTRNIDDWRGELLDAQGQLVRVLAPKED